MYIRSYDTGHSFDPIFMKFTWLVRAHSRVDPSIFGNNRPNKSHIWGKMCPQNQFFGFKSDGMYGSFWGKNLKTVFLYFVPHLPKKRLYSFLSSDHPVPQKWCRHPKIIFRLYFGKYCLYRKSCHIKNIQNVDVNKKKVILIFVPGSPSPQNGHALPQMG